MTSVDVPIADATRKLLEANWRDDDWFGCDTRVIFHYAMKAAICRRYAPRRIIFLCIDGAMDHDSYDCLAHAKRMIEKHAIDADLVIVDSHAIKSLPPADFAHVDGDHSYAGALADLRLVAGCRAILADDCDNREVRRAVDQFALEQNRTVEFINDGLRIAGVIA